MLKSDLRFKKTEKALKDAFLDLLLTTEISKLSVKTICEKAQISRNAFYQHYETKEHLYQSIQIEILLAIEDACKPVVNNIENITISERRQYLDNILTAVDNNRDKIHKLLISQPAHFSMAFRDMLIKSISKPNETFATKVSMAYIHIFSGAISTFISYWLLETELSLLEAQEQLFDILENLGDHNTL